MAVKTDEIYQLQQTKYVSPTAQIRVNTGYIIYVAIQRSEIQLKILIGFQKDISYEVGLKCFLSYFCQNNPTP